MCDALSFGKNAAHGEEGHFLTETDVLVASNIKGEC
jgi:hypothetical protein